MALEDRVAALERLVAVAQRSIAADVLYGVQDVADLLGCGKTNVYDLISSGKLAVVRVGAGSKGFRVRGSDLLAFLDDQREGGPASRGSFKYLGRYLR